MKYVIGNWKMNGDKALLSEFIPLAANAMLCVPFHLIGETLGAQDCSTEDCGARTGEISARMIREAGAKYCLVGHSERRRNHNETDELVHAKAMRCLEAGVMPIICIENPAEVLKSVPKTDGKIIVAFEPVGSIGTGNAMTADEIRRTHEKIAEIIPGTDILYGGSVAPANAREILAIDNVAGVLVGGASLDPKKFKEIVDVGK
ncbi:MAG: triose-phosphate isomerase [Rickettsiales bacterium]|jgi:triosephosphate isomerase|nr:triose-phosphate isomerase [Rickettsiales bacterium]